MPAAFGSSHGRSSIWACLGIRRWRCPRFALPAGCRFLVPALMGDPNVTLSPDTLWVVFVLAIARCTPGSKQRPRRAQKTTLFGSESTLPFTGSVVATVWRADLGTMLSNGLKAPMALRPTSVAGSCSQYRRKPTKVSRGYGAAPLAGPFALQEPRKTGAPRRLDSAVHFLHWRRGKRALCAERPPQAADLPTEPAELKEVSGVVA